MRASTLEKYRVCGVIPTYNNPRTIADVTKAVRSRLEHVIVVDDGSEASARATVEGLAELEGVTVVLRGTNGGKGAAVLDGIRRAKELGFSHALQVDADGQHRVADIPLLVAASRDVPEALVTGQPVFDETAPRSRLMARQLSVFWVGVETGGRVRDPLCGFRVYPVDATLACGVRGRYMDFDPEVAVRLAWHGAPVVNIPTRVRYLTEAEGGVSHFRVFKDNALISVMHSRLMLELIGRRIFRRGSRDS